MKKDTIDQLFENLEGTFNVQDTPKGHQHRFLDKLNNLPKVENTPLII